MFRCVYGNTFRLLYGKDELFIKAQMDFYRETDVDFIKLSADKYFFVGRRLY